MVSTKISFLCATDKSFFLETYNKILVSLINFNEKSFANNMGQETEWMKIVFQYNVGNPGKTFRNGFIVPAVYKAILSKRIPASEESLELASVLGWIVELYHSAFQISADIIDDRQYQTESNANVLTWHKMNKVGMNSVNDTFILQMATHNLLKIYFDQSPIFMNLANLCRETIQKRICGNLLKKRFGNNENDPACYTMEHYRQVTNWSMSYHSFYLPIAFAWTLAGNEVIDDVRMALKRLAFELGYYHKMQRDYEEIFEKRVNTDKTGKWNWFYVKSVEMLDANGKGGELAKLNNLMKNGDNESLRAFYKSLKVKEMYVKETDRCQKVILEQIKNLPDSVMREMDVKVFEDIFSLL